MALCNLLVPWISFLWVLFLVITLLGVTFGYLDAGLLWKISAEVMYKNCSSQICHHTRQSLRIKISGLQGVILKIWGPSASRPLIYLYHFTVGVGGFVAPFIGNVIGLTEYETWNWALLYKNKLLLQWVFKYRFYVPFMYVLNTWKNKFGTNFLKRSPFWLWSMVKLVSIRNV